MVIACWCQREAGVNGAPPLSKQEQEELNFLYEEWAHPFFISIQEFCRLMEVSEGAGQGREGHTAMLQRYSAAEGAACQQVSAKQQRRGRVSTHSDQGCERT
jgi:hypothetical protein